MDVKVVSKNNVGAVATLLLIILLSHARFFDFLVDSALGRAILILFILGISYTNKILGVVAVLFIIISINNSDIGYLEGFDDANNITEKTNKVDDKKVYVKKVDDKKAESKSIEGFNITEREHMMLKGKRSNEAIVYSNSHNSDDDVEPSNKSIFTDNYSSV
jgi:hypothetical protein